MSIRFLKGLAVAGALLGASVIAPNASASETLRVRVPFQFVAGSQTLPAGEYAIEKMNDTGLLVLQGLGMKKAATVVFTVPVNYSPAGAIPGLVFSGDNSHRVLSRILLQGGEASVIGLK